MQRQPVKHTPRRNYSKEDVKARHSMAPADAAKHAIRLSNLKKIQRAFKDEDKLAIALELSPLRVRELLAGAPITAEMAMHIEDELHLAGGWLSNPASVYVAPPARRSDVQSEPEPSAQETGGQRAKGPSKQAGGAKLSLPTRPAAPKAASAAVKKTPAPPTGPVVTKKASRKPAPAPVVVSDESMQQIRKMNLLLLTEQKGEKAALSRTLGVDQSLISLKLGSRPLTRDFCSSVEKAYELEEGWMDVTRLTLPEGVKRLGGDLRRGRPALRADAAPKTQAKSTPAKPATAATPPAAKPAVAAPEQLPAATPAPAQAARAPEPRQDTAVPRPAPADATTTTVLARALVQLITAKVDAGTLPYDKVVRLMTELTD